MSEQSRKINELSARIVELEVRLARGPNVVIFMEGGLIQNSVTDSPVNLVIVDFDVEGVPTDERSHIPDHNFKDFLDAYCRVEGAEVEPERVAGVLGACYFP